MMPIDPQPVPAPPATTAVMVTASATAPADGTVLATPGGLPDIVVQTMRPLAQVAVRALRTYVQGVVGFLLLNLAASPVMAGLGVVVPPADFLAALKVAAGLALAPAAIAVLMNAGELLARLDESWPKARA